MANFAPLVISAGQVEQLQSGDVLLVSALQATNLSIGASTVIIGGNVTVVGAFTTSITVTANTSVTLPSSGLLASIAMSRRIAFLRG